MPALARLSALLFCSGACALVYQVVWQREFRLIFGASTAASAAVLAIFALGLGMGALLIGPRADHRRNPLLFYARLEAVIALSAAATPALLAVARRAYLGLGGTLALGSLTGTLLRLLLALLVLAVPTLMMGGTLPAAARAAASNADVRRRSVAILYGANTLGAVAGSTLATFVLLEPLGDRATLWLACALNLTVSLLARLLSRGMTAAPELAAPESVMEPPAAPPRFVLGAAFGVGFAFFLMELVWYRMLAPLLGGSVFTFGLILAVALLGIGLGGTFHAFFAEGRPATLAGFAATCLIEAACLGGAYALGDRVALLALLLRPLGGLGFAGHVLGWTAVCGVVVLPAAFVAGVQFPLLIALLGQGRAALGRQIGQAYAWNTAGAILGSLAGGFGLLPFLGAPACWLVAAFSLLGVGATAMALSAVREGRPLRLLPQAAFAILTLALTSADGPSAAWRHSGIGAGRANAGSLGSPNSERDFLYQERRRRYWEIEGVESSVALVRRLGMAFAVNGKIDGHFTFDAPTQLMGGVLAAALHPAPRRALVIGLGTGTSGGWLAALPGMERVDVVELEPGTLSVARAAHDVNHEAISNSRLGVTIADAREALLTGRGRYDIVFSEPSNPYRAGIASLFTREFYEAAADRLEPDGVFVQWVQSYEVSVETVRDVYKTLGTVFPEVETWRTHRDLLLLATRKPPRHGADALRMRLAAEPYRSGLAAAWRVLDLEGFLGYFVARPALARALADADPRAPNTDDANRLEFGFARAVGARGLFDMSELLSLARERGDDRPALDGDVDWERVVDQRLQLYGNAGADWSHLGEGARARANAYARQQNGDLTGALQAWSSQPRAPRQPLELALVAEGLAADGNEAALPFIDALRAVQPVEADAILAQLRRRQGRGEEARQAIAAAFIGYRQNPWPRYEVMLRALGTLRDLALEQPARATPLVELLTEPFAGFALDEERLLAAFEITTTLGMLPACVHATAAFEPWVPWRREFLATRAACYEAAGDPRAAAAKADLIAFESDEPERLTPSSIKR